jgi:uncharacterized protein (DUF2252 family)
MAVSVVESELTTKHEEMKADSFLFFRGTYYRWAQLWPVAYKEEARAPRVLAVGDLHVGSFANPIEIVDLGQRTRSGRVYGRTPG